MELEQELMFGGSAVMAQDCCCSLSDVLVVIPHLGKHVEEGESTLKNKE